jgi:hypothetical protein
MLVILIFLLFSSSYRCHECYDITTIFPETFHTPFMETFCTIIDDSQYKCFYSKNNDNIYTLCPGLEIGFYNQNCNFE